MMTNEDQNCQEIDVAKHEGDIRIYNVDDTSIWLQSDVSVDEVLEATDADPTYAPTTQNNKATNPDEEDSDE